MSTQPTSPSSLSPVTSLEFRQTSESALACAVQHLHAIQHAACGAALVEARSIGGRRCCMLHVAWRSIGG